MLSRERRISKFPRTFVLALFKFCLHADGCTKNKKVFGGMKAKRGRVRPLRTDRSGIGGHIITQQEEREGESCCPDMFSYLRLAIWGSTAVRQYAIGKKEASLVASTYTKFNVTTASDVRKKHRDPHHSAILRSGVVWSRYSNTTKDSFFCPGGECGGGDGLSSLTQLNKRKQGEEVSRKKCCH